MKKARQRNRALKVNLLLTIAWRIQAMAQIGFDSHSFGVAPGDNHCADMRGPGAGYVIPLMMRKKFIGETMPKVVRLSNIYRVPPPIVPPLFAEDIDASHGIKRNAINGKVLKFVARPAESGPNEDRAAIESLV
jgi:hypothetical protein